MKNKIIAVAVVILLIGGGILTFCIVSRTDIESPYIRVSATGSDGHSEGLGYFISKDGKLVTNYHVIAGASSITVYDEEQTFTVENILAYDAHTDLAVLKIDARTNSVTFSDKTPDKDDTVTAYNKSMLLEGTILRTEMTASDEPYCTFYSVDIAIESGMSGGALLNSENEVIGTVSRMSKTEENIGFAIPTAYLNELEYLVEPLSVSDFYKMTYCGDEIRATESIVYADEGTAVVTLISPLGDGVILDCVTSDGATSQWGKWYQDGTMIDLYITKNSSEDSSVVVSDGSSKAVITIK